MVFLALFGFAHHPLSAGTAILHDFQFQRIVGCATSFPAALHEGRQARGQTMPMQRARHNGNRCEVRVLSGSGWFCGLCPPGLCGCDCRPCSGRLHTGEALPSLTECRCTCITNGARCHRRANSSIRPYCTDCAMNSCDCRCPGCDAPDGIQAQIGREAFADSPWDSWVEQVNYEAPESSLQVQAMPLVPHRDSAKRA